MNLKQDILNLKITYHCLVATFFTSCAPNILIVNETGSVIETVVLLNKEEQNNFELTLDDIESKNILSKGLSPDEELSFKQKGYLSIVAISDDYACYLKNDVQEEMLIIDKSLYNSTEYEVSYEIDMQSYKVKLKIQNQSVYTIKQVGIEMSRYNYGRTIEIDNVMNFWNLIFPSKTGEITYEYFARKPSELSAVIIVGELNGEQIRKKYTEDLDALIVFN